MLKKILMLVAVGILPLGVVASGIDISRGELKDLRSSVFFAFDRYSLDNNARIAIESIFNTVDVPECANLLLIGYADERGGENYNIRLGWSRAETVRDMLVQKGFSKDHIAMKSLGASRTSYVWENVEQSHQYNRVVEIYVLPRYSWYREFRCKQILRDAAAAAAGQ